MCGDNISNKISKRSRLVARESKQVLKLNLFRVTVTIHCETVHVYIPLILKYIGSKRHIEVVNFHVFMLSVSQIQDKVVYLFLFLP